jgi:hypothetical protein
MDHFLFSGRTRKRLTIRFIPLDSSAEAEKNLRNQIWGGKDRGNQQMVQVFSDDLTCLIFIFLTP